MKTPHFFLINVFLGLLWMILNRQTGIAHFALGFLIGFGILWLFQTLFKSEPYARQVVGFFSFFLSFFWLFLRSNVNIAVLILRLPFRKIQPAYYAYSIEGLTQWEALLMSQCITLTPGTVSVKLEEKVLWVHFIDLSNIEEGVKNLDLLKSLVLRLTGR